MITYFRTHSWQGRNSWKFPKVLNMGKYFFIRRKREKVMMGLVYYCSSNILLLDWEIQYMIQDQENVLSFFFFWSAENALSWYGCSSLLQVLFESFLASFKNEFELSLFSLSLSFGLSSKLSLLLVDLKQKLIEKIIVQTRSSSLVV